MVIYCEYHSFLVFAELIMLKIWTIVRVFFIIGL